MRAELVWVCDGCVCVHINTNIGPIWLTHKRQIVNIWLEHAPNFHLFCSFHFPLVGHDATTIRKLCASRTRVGIMTNGIPQRKIALPKWQRMEFSFWHTADSTRKSYAIGKYFKNEMIMMLMMLMMSMSMMMMVAGHSLDTFHCLNAPSTRT